MVDEEEQRLLPLSSQPCMAQSESLTAIEIACCFIRAHVYRQYFSFVDRFIHRENVWLLQHRPVTWRRSFLKKRASPLTAFGGMLRQTLILNLMCCFMPLDDYKLRFLPNGVVSQICDGLASFLQLRSVARWVVPYMDRPLYDRCCLLHKRKKYNRAMQVIFDSGFLYQTWPRPHRWNGILSNGALCCDTDTGLPLGMSAAYFEKKVLANLPVGWLRGRLYL